MIETTVLDLVQELQVVEKKAALTEESLQHFSKAVNEAGLKTRIFKAKELRSWVEKRKTHTTNLAILNEKWETLREGLSMLGYDSEDIEKIRSVIDQNFLYHLQKKHSLIGLLSQSSQSSLLVEFAMDKRRGYTALMTQTEYIDSFPTGSEKLSFINGFLSNGKAAKNLSDAYKIGVVFRDAHTKGIDLGSVLGDCAPNHLHSLEMVELGLELASKGEQLPSEMKVKELPVREFYGKVDFLGLNRSGETIVGETLFYNNYRDFRKEVEDSFDCGRPIDYNEISKEEYEKNLISGNEIAVA